MSHSGGEVALMDGAACPSSDVLSQYLQGKLAEAEISLVASHVESCRRCDAIAESLEFRFDTLLDNLRRAGRNGQYMGEPELWKTLRRLLSMCRDNDDVDCLLNLSQFPGATN